MSEVIQIEDLAAYVEHHKMLARNALEASKKANAEFGELTQAFVDIGSRALNGEPGKLNPVERERVARLIREARAFKRISATVGEA